MAIYHAHVASGGRADGQSAALKVAYILREGPHGGHDDLVEWGSGNMPPWAAADPRKLFAAADAFERVNGRLYLHVWVALPNELDEEQRHELVLAIGAALTASGLPYVYAVHAGDPKSPGEAANPHAHFVLSERMNDGIARDEALWFRRANRREPAAGGAAKDRALKEVTWVEDTRKVIEQLINEHLALAGREERVTADSHATRIVEAEAWGDTWTAEHLRLHPPGVHLGPAAAAMERDRFRGKRDEKPEVARAGERTERGNLARARAAEEEWARGELMQVARKLEGARRELEWATDAVELARAVGLTDEEIVREHAEAESVSEGSGWTAVYEMAVEQGERGEQLEAEAAGRGIELGMVYEDAAARGENAVVALERVIGIVDSARPVRLTFKDIRCIWEKADSSQRGSGWRAVEESVRARWARKERLEAAAAEVDVNDVESVYVAAESRGEDPLTALEELTAKLAAGLEELRSQPGGRELYIAWRTELYPDVANTEGGEVQGSVEWDRERLERARAVLETRWGRTHYVAATRALGDRFSLEKFDAVVTEAEAFDRRAGELSDGVGCEKLEAAVGEGKNPTVAELVAALERAKEMERAEEAERRETARRDAAVRRREAAVRKTNSGQAWLNKAKEDVLQGADRRPTLEERERIVEMAEGWVREGLDRRQNEIRSTKEGARFLDETQSSAGAEKTLAAEEQYVQAAAVQLYEFLCDQPGGENLHDAVLTGLDPEWRDSGESTVENFDRAVTLALSDGERLGRLRDVLAERGDATRFRKALNVRQEHFTVDDIDAAIDVVLRHRAAAAERQRAEEEARQQQAEEEARQRRAEEEARQREEESRRQAKEQRRRERDRLWAEQRGTSAGERRLKAERRSRFGAKRSLTLDEELSLLRSVVTQVQQEFDDREEAIKAVVAGGALFERVANRSGVPVEGLARREEVIEAVELRLRAADVAATSLSATAPDPKRPDHRVPPVLDVILDSMVADEDGAFLADVVFGLRARYARRAQPDVAAGGYDASAREQAARRHFGDALRTAFQWCVLKIKAIILAACHKVLGGRGTAGEQVEASLERAEQEQRKQQTAVQSAAQDVAIDVRAFFEAARRSGRDAVAVLMEETARRRQVHADALAVGVDVQKMSDEAERHEKGSGFDAIEAALEYWQNLRSTARAMGIVDAVWTSAQARGQDPVAALEEAIALGKEVNSYANAINLPRERFEAIFATAEEQSPGSGYQTVRAECVRTMAREEVRKVLPFEASDRARPGDRKLAMSGEPARILLRMVESDQFAHTMLSEVLDESAGSAEERAAAQGFYHQRRTRIELEKQEREHGWLSSKPTEEGAMQAVLDRFLPMLAERVRKACREVCDLNGLTARMVDEDRVRRMGVAVEQALPRASTAYGSQAMAVSVARFSGMAERTDNASIREFVSTQYLEGFGIDDYSRSQAEEVYLRKRIRARERETGERQEMAEAAVNMEYEAELLRIIERVWREIQARPADDIRRERARRAEPAPQRPTRPIPSPRQPDRGSWSR